MSVHSYKLFKVIFSFVGLVKGSKETNLGELNDTKETGLLMLRKRNHLIILCIE